MKIYTVNDGDTLYNIAEENNVDVKRLSDDNQLYGSDKLIKGQSLVIRDETKKSIVVNGYVYPFINYDILYSTLPFLTFISIFSYHVNEDGDLLQLKDNEIINESISQNVGPIMVVTNMTNSGFDSNIANVILNDETKQEKLINNILKIIKENEYKGVNIDFEYIYQDDKDAYNNFIKKISDILKNNNYILITSLAPKVYKEQPGLLYEAHDYNFHGQYADYVILMTYEWGYTYGPPMAVSPLNQVERVLNYAISEIPSEKILMGIPNYGYDWTLPYEKGVAAKSISNAGAIELANRKGSVIEFDNISMAPYFHYIDANGKAHEVWFEDARSIEAKLSLVNKYNLGGVSYWQLTKIFNQNFIVLSDMYNIEKN